MKGEDGGDREGYGRRMERGKYGVVVGVFGEWGVFGGGDASSECVDVTFWLRLNVQE